MKKVLLLHIVALSLSVMLNAFDGQLDNTFGTDGLVLANFGGNDMDAQARAVVIRYDGKIVVGGSVVTGTTSADFGLMIFDDEGMMEAMHQQHVGAAGNADRINGLAVQPDNKVVAVGRSTNMAGDSSFIVARYKVNGTLDETFNPAGETPGVVFVDFFNAVQAEASAVALKRDGRIVVVGAAQDASLLPGNTNQFYAVTVLNQDGSFDTSFANGAGRVVYSTAAISGNNASRADAVTIQSVGNNDNIIIAGEATLVALPMFTSFQIARITCEGMLDTNFAASGVDTVSFGNLGDEKALGVDVYPDGRIIAVGSAVTSSDIEAISLTRRLINGGADTTFNMAGAIPGQNQLEIAMQNLIGNAVNIQNDGKILIAGVQQDDTTGDSYFILIRFSDAGELDTSFGGNPGPGYVTTNFGGMPPTNIAYTLALQQNGKIILVGAAQVSNTDPLDVALACYLNSNGGMQVFVGPTIEHPQSLDNCITNPPILSGVAQNPSNITAYANGEEIGRSITTGDQNIWHLIPNTQLSEGANTFQIVAEYKSGNMNAISDPVCCGVGVGLRSCISEAIREKYCPSCLDSPNCG